jgi:hypothetical protein
MRFSYIVRTQHCSSSLSKARSPIQRFQNRDHLPGGEVDERADMIDGAMPEQTGEESESVRREDLVDERRLPL